MNKSERFEELFGKNRAVPRFLWNEGPDPNNPVQACMFLTHTQAPIFVCQVVGSGSPLPQLSAPVSGKWLSCRKRIWDCTEFTAGRFCFSNEAPCYQSVHNIMVEAVRSFRRRRRDEHPENKQILNCRDEHQNDRQGLELYSPASDKPPKRKHMH